ncbi:hypothetical protein TGAM01_v210925 [Trichoderma gamsii]|uniref:Uncharacterized protein n=1 Tax=Trichoderma gamsii TaxID=398673 RepID=A0A2P4Z7E2_9HYPO|nr:hypothetical protein TGAM01_v210925 [Trichoderma gamsii]PON20204.1 hypothetical protein TGAM01_v210925 [Trichoderma gamsii]
MAFASCTRPPFVACAENIALLYFLHDVPTPPSDNFIKPPPAGIAGKYTLTFQEERNLVGALAFLSRINDNPNHICAIAILEAITTESLNVLIAINKAKFDDGNHILQQLKDGFESICSQFSQAPDSIDSDVEGAVFAAIISMCSKRILCRLRFTNTYRKATRQPITLLLQKAMALRSVEPFHTFMERSRDVIKFAESWKKQETPDKLGSLVRSIHHLSKTSGFQDVIETISNKEMDPCSRKYLLNGVRKVARYFEAARFLCNLSKKHPSIQRLRFILIKPPLSAFEETPAALCTSTFSSMIARISSLHGLQWNADRICNILGTNEIEASRGFIGQTNKILLEAKIHAEIQLILHCETNKFTLQPRVICASKDACFLCNAFILTHGKLHVPRHHGRLYPAWRLPPVLGTAEIARQFILILENQIRDSIENSTL